MEDKQKRIYIGGLAPETTVEELTDKFGQLATVINAEVIKDENGNCRGFGYVTLIPKDTLAKCISLLNKTKWRGRQLKIEEAKESYNVKLEKEWKEMELQIKSENDLKQKKLQNNLPNSALNYLLMPIAFEPVLDDKKLSMWKRGKGGRLLPILTMKRKNGKVLEIDPSKLKERITIFNDDKYIPTQSYQLTWSYDQPIEQEKQPQKAVIPTFDDEISQKLKEEKARSLRLLNTMFSTAEKPQHEMQQSVNINSDDSSNDEKIQNLDKKRKLNIETDLLEEDENKIKPKEKKKKINPKIQQSTSNGKDNRFIHINTDLLSLFKGNTTFTISAVPPDTPKK